MAYRQLGDILVAADAIGRDALQAVLRQQASDLNGPRIGERLVESGQLSPEALTEALAEQSGIPLCTRTHPDECLHLDETLPYAFMLEHRVLFLTAEGDEPACAIIDDPTDSATLEAIRHHGNPPIQLVTHPQMEKALEQAHQFAATKLNLAEAETFEAGDNWSEGEEHLRDLALEAPVVRMVNLIISRAVEKRASDIHVEADEYSLRIRYRVDGVLHETDRIDKKHHAAITSRIKLLAHLDIAERRIPQDGRIKTTVEGHDLDMRVATTPTIHGEGIVIRLLSLQHVELNFGSLGMPEHEQQTFTNIIEQPQGFVLVTGPTGSGKTTTLHTALSHLNCDAVKIITIEDPVEIRLAGINQIQMNSKTGMTFANGLRSIVRQDPDIVMVGEIRDAETADIAIQAALTGHMVLSTLHTNDAAGSVARLADMGVENYLIASALSGVLAQRLCRRVCPYCAEDVEFSHGQLLDFQQATEASYTFKHGAGCDACDGTGYYGRVGLYELMEVNDEMRSLIQRTAEAGPIRELGRKNGMKLLRETGWHSILNGQTTCEEVRRVTQWS
ncbi:GspE/PulE family protein [Verrucomicrobiota bacterium]